MASPAKMDRSGYSTFSVEDPPPPSAAGGINSSPEARAPAAAGWPGLVLGKHFGKQILEQVKSVAPVAGYLMIFQFLVLGQDIAELEIILLGLASVLVGLTLFLEGLTWGLMPLGSVIGVRMPIVLPLWGTLLITFILGVGVTFAEPAIGALQSFGDLVSVERSPYVYALLNDLSLVLVFMVAAGVGVAAMLGGLRFGRGWKLRPMLYVVLVPTLILSVVLHSIKEMRPVVGLAWDCGAVTTGPVTVPMVLSLGHGMASSSGSHDPLSGFGIVSLASLYPILSVEILAMFLYWFLDRETILDWADEADEDEGSKAWNEKTPWSEIFLSLQAIVPLVIFVLLVLKYVLKTDLPRVPLAQVLRQRGMDDTSPPDENERSYLRVGLGIALLGRVMFALGLTQGLIKLGEQVGSIVPGSYTEIEDADDSPFFSYEVGLFVSILFAWLLGFGATLAEPALGVLGEQVEDLSQGRFKKRLLIYSVCFGVAIGIASGVVKIIYDIPIVYFILPTYAIAVGLTVVSSEEYVNVAWDSGGVTTGEITVPLVLAMGLAFGNASNATDGFGVLTLASICPIISVLITGLLVAGGRARQEATDPEQVDQGLLKDVDA